MTDHIYQPENLPQQKKYSTVPHVHMWVYVPWIVSCEVSSVHVTVQSTW